MEFELSDIEEISLNFDVDIKLPDFGETAIEQRIHKPKYHKPIKAKNIKYDNAVKMAKDIGGLNPNERVNCLIAGNFIFGDFVEAFIVENDLSVKNLSISTLSMSQENVDSLENLLSWGYVDKLNLLVSSYFWGHERWKLVPYIFEKLDIDDKFQLAVSANHCKIVLIETNAGDKIVIHGSANLRSSDCIEQITIENDKELFDFHSDFIGVIVDKFKTIDKEIKGNRGKKLWQQVGQERKGKPQV